MAARSLACDARELRAHRTMHRLRHPLLSCSALRCLSLPFLLFFALSFQSPFEFRAETNHRFSFCCIPIHERRSVGMEERGERREEGRR